MSLEDNKGFNQKKNLVIKYPTEEFGYLNE